MNQYQNKKKKIKMIKLKDLLKDIAEGEGEVVDAEEGM
jgi:hypothetical protein